MYDHESIAAIKNELRRRDETLAVGESVTSGHLQAAFSLADGATSFFQGGVTAYNLLQKTRHLNVDPVEAQKCNCVSADIARQMAIHGNSLFATRWCIGITGYAALMPDAGIDHLFAFYAIAFDNKIVMENKLQAEPLDIADVQLFYTNGLLKQFAGYLKQNP